MRQAARAMLTALLLVAPLVTAMPVAVMAGSGVTTIMHGWKSELRNMHDMLTGRAGFNEQAVTRALTRFAGDAALLEEQIHGQDAPARDLRQRFVAFQADASAALGHAAQRSALAADVSRLSQHCESCHDVYNN